MIDAIARTLYRLFVSHKNMLEWVAAAHVQSITGLSLGSFLWPLRSASIVAIITSACVLYFNPAGFRFAVPFILLWWASPLVARAISLPPKTAATNPLGPAESTRMRLIARRTWRFFTTFVTAEDNWLPPDNFQEDPKPSVAHRSSPTNFGLSLLSTAAARDFGWLGLRDMTERLENTLNTFSRMPQYRGHFYNWYDTLDLTPLEPRYISAVDSGNFAGHLLALEQACRELMRKPIFSRSDLDGVSDALLLLSEAMAEASDQRRTITVDRTQVQDAIDEVVRLLASDPASAWEWCTLWSELELASKTLLDIVQTFADERADELDSEIVAWAKAVHADIVSHVNDLQLLPPFDPPAHPERAALTSSAAARAPAQSVDGSTSLLSLYELSMLPSREPSGESSGEPLTVAQAQAREQSARACVGVLDRLEGIAVEARRMFDEMDFRFLFDPKRKLFSVGFRVSDSLLDDSFYDLLASEARLTSFIAIAKGEIPVAHWFKMGRPLAPEDEGAVLISWSGSMFEYLMPSLIMYTPSHSLLDQTCRLSVKHQIRYGNERGVPWGVSESAYYMRDRSLTYQYSAFGVPGLGFKRGLRQDMVVAPYATALAAMY
ncbi:MAG: phosphorylase, partial [Betaproteobacteria bacterium]